MIPQVGRLLAGITALVIAITPIYLAISGDDAPPPSGGVIVVLDSPAAYAAFLEGHPG